MVELGGWILECDPEATRRAYAQISTGDPETCSCSYCRNFVATRSAAYPDGALQLYAQLGVSPDREAEVYELGPPTSGPGRLYGGWHHFVGHVIKDPGRLVTITPSFEMWFREARDLAAPVFGEQSLVQAEFNATVPWVLDESPGGSN